MRSVKRCSRKSIARSSLNVDEKNILLIEVESIINSRDLELIYAMIKMAYHAH